MPLCHSRLLLHHLFVFISLLHDLVQPTSQHSALIATMASNEPITNYYPYDPSHALPIVFAVLIGISFLIHTWQNL